MNLSNIFQPLIDVFKWILEFFHDHVGLSWGFSIVALTVVVRLVLLPLTIKQFKSMQRLAKLQPELKKIQEQHKGDPERRNKEMMRFYKENKVNPFASCLPLLAQLPVFLSLFYMLRSDLKHEICPGKNPKLPCGETPESHFLFIPDLTNNAVGWVLVALIVLYVASQLLSTMLSSATTDRNQKILMYGLPLLFVPIIWDFPAGLLVYWITTNIWTIGQQAVIRRRIGPIVPVTATVSGDEGKSEKRGGLRELVAAGASKKDGEESERQQLEVKATKKTANKEKSSKPVTPPRSSRKKKKRSGRRR